MRRFFLLQVTLLLLGILLDNTEVMLCHCLVAAPKHPEVFDSPRALSGPRYRGAAVVSGWGTVSLGKITPASCERGIISSWAEAA